MKAHDKLKVYLARWMFDMMNYSEEVVWLRASLVAPSDILLPEGELKRAPLVEVLTLPEGPLVHWPQIAPSKMSILDVGPMLLTPPQKRYEERCCLLDDSLPAGSPPC